MSLLDFRKVATPKQIFIIKQIEKSAEKERNLRRSLSVMESYELQDQLRNVCGEIRSYLMMAEVDGMGHLPAIQNGLKDYIEYTQREVPDYKEPKN